MNVQQCKASPALSVCWGSVGSSLLFSEIFGIQELQSSKLANAFFLEFHLHFPVLYVLHSKELLLWVWSFISHWNERSSSMLLAFSSYLGDLQFLWLHIGKHKRFGHCWVLHIISQQVSWACLAELVRFNMTSLKFISSFIRAEADIRVHGKSVISSLNFVVGN